MKSIVKDLAEMAPVMHAVLVLTYPFMYLSTCLLLIWGTAESLRINSAPFSSLNVQYGLMLGMMTILMKAEIIVFEVREIKKRQ